MSIAFTAVPKSFDVANLLLTRHSRLFDQGLSERHFDMVAHHFTATLQEMGVDDALAKEALEVVMPLRDVFRKGAEEARQRKTRADRKRTLTLAAFMVLVTVGGMQLAKRMKK